MLLNWDKAPPRHSPDTSIDIILFVRRKCLTVGFSNFRLAGDGSSRQKNKPRGWSLGFFATFWAKPKSWRQKVSKNMFPVSTFFKKEEQKFVPGMRQPLPNPSPTGEMHGDCLIGVILKSVESGAFA